VEGAFKKWEKRFVILCYSLHIFISELLMTQLDVGVYCKVRKYTVALYTAQNKSNFDNYNWIY
jgi:hypothetical protein